MTSSIVPHRNGGCNQHLGCGCMLQPSTGVKLEAEKHQVETGFSEPDKPVVSNTS